MWPLWQSQTPWENRRQEKTGALKGRVIASDPQYGNILVCGEFLTNEPSRDLSHNVSPEEGAVDHSHRFWIPIKLSVLFRTVNNTVGWIVRRQRGTNGFVPVMSLLLTTTISLLSLKMVWLLTMLTMATPKLHRIPKEMQKPMPERMAMM